MLCLLAGFLPAVSVLGGEVETESGFTIRGTPVNVRSLDHNRGVTAGQFNIRPFTMVDDGMRRYFIPKPPPAKINAAADLSRYEKFKIEQKPLRTNLQLNNIGQYKTVIPLNEFGRKTVEVTTPNGPKNIILGMTEINPFHVTWESINLVQWKFAETTTSIPDHIIRTIINSAIDPNDSSDRMSIARFYLQTRQYHLALGELLRIRQEFPEIAEQVEKMLETLQTVWANQLLGDLEVRQQSGQHQLASKMTEEFLKLIPNPAPEVGQRIREIQSIELRLNRQINDARLMLGELQAQIEDDDLRQQVQSVRMLIDVVLDAEGVSRLEPFLNLAGDDSLSAEEKLALAFSGWILGPANANTDLKNTLRQWDARHLILEFLRNTDPTRTASLIDSIERAEGIGPSTLVPILEHLPGIVPTEGLQTNYLSPQTLELETFSGTEKSSPVKYRAILPLEYSPHHAYPLIIHMRPATIPLEKSIRWWGDQAPRRGYIVVSPEYLGEEDREYDYSPNSLETMERCVRDAMRRFRIDSNRIFLAGHGSGAEAAFDYGMAQPGLFAGIIAISGKCQHHCKYTRNNDPNLALYVISGEKDRNLLTINAEVLERMMISKKDIIYTEYIGRGVDDYYEEIHQLFDWMEKHRLQRGISEIDVKLLRPQLKRFYWYEVHEFPEVLYTNDPITNPKELTDWNLVATLATGQNSELQTLYFRGRRPDKVTIWLTPSTFDFDKRLTVKDSRGRITKQLIDEDVRAMLEDFSRRADREEIARAKIELE
ncbi:MAG: hypothetical protein HUJ26_09815 [Planctomycetaceae bacterium]|nr:hypothetical protein [Planctomycetaceae bacterium]